jgi:HSP20 family protein
VGPFASLPHAPGWRPAADVYRTKKGWLVKLDLAGVEPEDVSCSVSGDELTVGGARRDFVISADCQAQSMEISYNQFERTIRLPVDLSGAKIDTESRHGMFLIWIQPKSAE